MCGRYDLSETGQRIAATLLFDQSPTFEPNSDVRPTDTRPILRLAGHRRDCILARWGLIPYWSSEGPRLGAKYTIAPAETLVTAMPFRDAYQRHRCLVPMNAFYEWSGPLRHQRKWRISVRDEPLFTVAGIWERWNDVLNPKAPAIESFAIITVPANDAIAKFHDRMPVIVAKEDHARWLDPSRDVRDLLAPYPSERIEIA